MKSSKNLKKSEPEFEKKNESRRNRDGCVLYVLCIATIGVFAAPREYIKSFCALMVMSFIGLIIAGAASHSQTEEPSTSP
jgi:hypothetical protein